MTEEQHAAMMQELQNIASQQGNEAYYAWQTSNNMQAMLGLVTESTQAAQLATGLLAALIGVVLASFIGWLLWCVLR